MKKKGSKIKIALLFLVGLSLLLYPLVANEWNTYRQSKLLNSYDEEVAKMEESGKVDYSQEWDRALQYNEALLPAVLPDSFAIAAAADEPDKEYMACMNLTGDGTIGYVEIPKIDVKIPIYHTVEEKILQIAAGHLEGSSLPTGGESTHAVISAHRGLPSAALFTDLDLMNEGDHFLLHVLDQTLCYQVDRISVVEPEDTKLLQVEEGKDYVTLLTCTPYGVNSHRLLVRGHRVPYVPEVVESEDVPFSQQSLHTNYLFWVLLGLAVTGLFVFILYLRERKLHKRRKRRRGRRRKVKR